MHEKEVNKLIGYAVTAIFAYYILQFVIPWLIWGVIAMVGWRVYQEFQKNKY